MPLPDENGAIYFHERARFGNIGGFQEAYALLKRIAEPMACAISLKNTCH